MFEMFVILGDFLEVEEYLEMFVEVVLNDDFLLLIVIGLVMW